MELDPTKLLGLSKWRRFQPDPTANAQPLNKISPEGPRPTVPPSRLAKLLSKIGGEGPPSDIRPKTDIQQVGTTAYNLPLYTR